MLIKATIVPSKKNTNRLVFYISKKKQYAKIEGCACSLPINCTNNTNYNIIVTNKHQKRMAFGE